MLKKLFAHEWKACWRLMAAVNGIVLVLTLIGIFVFNSNFWQMMENDKQFTTIFGIGLFTYFMFYIISIGALGFVVSLFFFIRFYKNMYTDEGYLMHTLPVTPAQLIWSKAFVGVIWQFISAIVIMFSIFMMIFSISSGAEGITMGQLFEQILSEINLEPGMMAYLILFIVLMIGLLVVSSFMSMFLGYTAISIGQLCKKQKVLGAIGAYIAIYIVMQFISSATVVPLTGWLDKLVVTDNQAEQAVIIMMVIAIIAVSLVTAALYFFNAHIMKNKLNLE